MCMCVYIYIYIYTSLFIHTLYDVTLCFIILYSIRRRTGLERAGSPRAAWTGRRPAMITIIVSSSYYYYE